MAGEPLCGAILTCALAIGHDGPHERADGVRWTWPGPMTLKETAALLNTSPDNLRGAIARGVLAATKIGRDWFVAAEEVRRYGVENRRAQKDGAA